MVNGIIFDCDGTLVESPLESYLLLYQEVMRKLGLPRLDEGDPEVIAYCVGRTNDECLEKYVPEPLRAAAGALVTGFDFRAAARLLSFEPHARETLDRLRPHHRLAIASNRDHDLAPLVEVLALDRLVDRIVGALDVERPKPFPDMLLLVAREFGLDPAEMLFIGDNATDHRASVAAGMPFAQYSPPGRPTPQSSPLDPVAVVLRDHRELLTYLDSPR